MRFAQVDDATVTGHLESYAMPRTLPPRRTFVEVEEFPEHGSVFDPQARTFTPPSARVIVPDPDDPREALKVVRTQLAAIWLKLGV